MKKTILLALLTPLLLGAQKFYDDDPLREMPPSLEVNDVKARKLNDYYDLFENTFGSPAEQQPEKEKGEPPQSIPASAVNTLGEVLDDPSWFINRIGSRTMTIDELVRGDVES